MHHQGREVPYFGQARTHAHSGVGNLDSSGVKAYLEQGNAVHHLLGQRQVDALEHISILKALPAVSRAFGRGGMPSVPQAGQETAL